MAEQKFDLEELRTLLRDDMIDVPPHIKEPREFLAHLHTAMSTKAAALNRALAVLDDDGDDDDVEEIAPGYDPNSPVLMGEGATMDGQSDDFKRLVAAMEKRGLKASYTDLNKIERNGAFWDALFNAAITNATTDGGIDIDGDPPEEAQMSLSICGHRLDPARRKSKLSPTDQRINDFEAMLPRGGFNRQTIV